MPDAQSPPPEVPIRSYPTPQIVDGLLIEEVDTRKANYVALQPGQPHEDITNFSGFIHVLTRPSARSEWVQRIYVNDRSNQNTYNASIGYDAESNSHPNYTRTYLVRRDAYTPSTKATALTGVVSIRVTNGGSGYTTVPTVSFSGGAGSGVTATAIIFREAVVGVIINAEGTGYTSAPTVSFSGGGGTGAAATAAIPPATAKLTKEAAERMDGDPVDSLYLRVTRLYETLPGATVTDKFYTETGELATRTRTPQLAGTGPDSDSLTTLSSKVEARDSVVEIKETITIPAHLPRVTYELYYESGQLKKIVTQIVNPATEPQGGDGIVSDIVKQLSATKAERETVSIVDEDGNPIDAYFEDVQDVMYPRERCMGKRYFKVVPANTQPLVEGAGIANGGKILPWGSSNWSTVTAYIIDFQSKRLQSGNLMFIYQTAPLPPQRFEYPRVPARFPAIFQFLDNWSVTTSVGESGESILSPPYLGRHFSYTAHRNSSQPGRATYIYTLGPPTGFPSFYKVSSPAAGSKLFNIPENCIHPAYSVHQDGVLVETVPASTPATYSVNNVLLVDGECVPWKGIIYESVFYQASENKDPGDF